MKAITIAKLREIIADAPETAFLVVPSHDHSYRPASVEVGTALFHPQCISEDFGEDQTPEEEYGKRLPVLIVR